MPIFEVDGTGVTVPSLEEALAAVRQQMADIFGDDLADADQTPQGQLAGIIAVLEAVIGEALTDLSNATSADDAVGAQQDALFGLLDVLRQVATRSRVTATLTGVAGTGVAAGSRARTAAGAEFRTIADVTIAPSPGVTVEMEAVNTGPVEALAGAITSIVTVIPGWETVTNASAAIPGTARQTDPRYRTAYRTRTAHRASGPLAALEAGLDEALAGKFVAKENNDDMGLVIQEWYLKPHAVLAIAQSGSNGDIMRAVETHRGMGAPTMTGIIGGTPDNNALDAVSNGTVSWNGTDYTGLDLTGASTPAEKATALTTLLAGTGVVVRAIDDIYIAMFGWHPSVTPMFGVGTVEADFGLAPAVSTYSPGPFVRTRDRDLTLTAAVSRQAKFPADGLNLLRAAVTAVVDTYTVGQQAWLGDFEQAMEAVQGTRVTSISLQHNSVDVSGVDVSLDSVYTLPAANITITIS